MWEDFDGLPDLDGYREFVEGGLQCTQHLDETMYRYVPHVVAWECVHMHGSIFELITPTCNVNVAFFL